MEVKSKYNESLIPKHKTTDKTYRNNNRRTACSAQFSIQFCQIFFWLDKHNMSVK